MKKNPNPSFTPEQELLLWLIRVDHTKDQRAAEILSAGVDWNYVRKTAIQHGIIPLLYKKLKNEMSDLVPSKELEEFRTLFMANAVRNLRMTQQLIKVLDHLSDAGIEAMPFKGPVLAVQAYGDLSMRSFSDLDIVIHRCDFEQTYDLLTKSGYSCALSGNQAHYLLKTDIELTFDHPEYHIDIHWAFAHKFMAFNVDTEKFFKESIVYLLQGKKLKGLCPEDTFLVLSIHGANHYWIRLKWIADIIFFIYQNPNMNWQKIFDKSKNFTMNTLLYQSLNLAIEMGGLSLPEEIKNSIHANNIQKKCKSLDKIRFQLFSKERLRLHSSLHIISRREERIPIQLKYFFSQIIYSIFTPKSRDLEIIDLPWFLYPLYLIIRPFRLIRDII